MWNFLLKIIDCLNPISIFKSIKKYIENRVKIEAKLIDKEKQRQHEKDLQLSISSENFPLIIE